MNSKAIKAWVMYDWANSAFATTMLAAVLPIFYLNVAGHGLDGNLATSYWGYTQSISMLIIAVASPVLGSIADLAGLKTTFLRWFTYLGIFSCLMFVWVGEGDWLLASCLFIVGNIGFSGGSTFYDAMLPDLVPYDRRDQVSAHGYAYGYIGGGLLLALNVLMIQMPHLFGLSDTLDGTRLAFASVAVWWFVFSLPLFRHIPNRPTHRGLSSRQYVVVGFGRAYETFREILRLPELLKFMLAFWFFNDGISTIIRMATIYGSEIGIDTTSLIVALLITQFVGIPFTFLFGGLAGKLGGKTSLQIALGTYLFIVILGYFMQTALHFYALAVMVGFVQGGSQAIARSMFSNLIPQAKSAAFFGFLNISSKFAAMFGPFVFALVGQLTGSSRLGILSLLFFFVVGMLLLAKVDVKKGSERAQQYDRQET